MGFPCNTKERDTTAAIWLAAIHQHVEHIQTLGHSQVQPTPLLADGLDVVEHQPVTWLFPDGHTAPISNFASQQNWLRTLTALSVVTGDDSFAQQAHNQTAYFLQHHVHPQSGLFYWGGHHFINLDTLQSEGPESKSLVHELKHHLPYYDLLASVDHQVTLTFLQSFWNAHVSNWQSLDLGRHGDYSKAYDPQVFQHARNDIVDPAVWPQLPETQGLTFVNAGTDLIYAAYKYAEYTGDTAAAAWGKHLYRQYVLARNPQTGMPVYQFSSPLQRQPTPADDNRTESWFGDRAQRQFGPEFGAIAREANVLFRDMRPLLIDNPLAMLDILRKHPDSEMQRWVIDGLKNYYRHAYDVTHNQLRPMWNDGQDMSGYRLQRDGYYGAKGTEIRPFPLEPDYLLPLVRAWRLSDDAGLLALIGQMLQRLWLAKLAPSAQDDEITATGAPVASPYLLFALIELAEARQSPALHELAWMVGGILFQRHYHHGFFVASAQHRYVRLDDPVALALLQLIASKQGRQTAMPVFLTNGGYLHGDYRINGESKVIYDVDQIYTSLLEN